jgi:hypothetical protein
MKSDSTKNKAPLAPASAEPTASSSAKPRVAPTEKGTLVKKKGAQAGDPTKMAKPARKNVLGALARGGARYGIRVKFQQTTAPEAGATQGNGRILPAAKGQSANWKSGSAE